MDLQTELDDLLTALAQWRAARPGSAAERHAARLLAFRAAQLLRAAGRDN